MHFLVCMIAGLAAIKELYLRSAEDLQRERAERDAKEVQLLEQAQNAAASSSSSSGGVLKAVVAKRGQNKKRPRDEEQVRTSNLILLKYLLYMIFRLCSFSLLLRSELKCYSTILFDSTVH
jgi:hypothetical protein